MSLSEVARQAGVSASTVSRYLRGQLNLSPATEDRVLQALENSDYQPKSNSSRPDRVIWLVVPDLSNPFFAELADATTMAAAARGHSLSIVSSGGSRERESAVVRNLVKNRQRVDGLLYVGMNPKNPAIGEAAGSIPMVIFDEPLSDNVTVPCVGADSFGGAVQATTYLISQGHRRIGHIGGPKSLNSAEDRYRGFRSAMENYDLEVDPSLVFRGPYTERFGANVWTQLAEADDMPSALFVGSDIVAVGLISAADLHGWRIPEDISVIGYDGITVGKWLRPKLSSVRQPISDLVSAALNTLSAQWAGQTPPSLTLPMELQVRQSVRRFSELPK